MRCHICDATLSKPNYNSDIEAYEPCDHCLSVIMDAVGSFGDRPAAAEDELGEDDPSLAVSFTRHDIMDRYSESLWALRD